MSNDLDLATLDHWFGWMRNSESWRREREIVYSMWAEIRGRKVELDSLRKDFGDLYDEVERLRALVRDIYDRHDLGSALDARMREALGE